MRAEAVAAMDERDVRRNTRELGRPIECGISATDDHDPLPRELLRIRDEIDVYNALLPAGDELSATMLIEITESDRIREELVRLIGIDEAVRLEIGDPTRGGFTARGEFEAGRSKADKLSAVQYVRFHFDVPARQAFINSTERVRLVIDHPNYRHSALIDGAVRRSLARDLEAA